MKSFVILFLLSGFLFAKNVLVINSYSAIFPWTASQSNAIVKELKKDKDIKVFIEFMDTKEFKPTQQSYANMLRYYSEKYKNTIFDIVVTTDDNAINFVLENQNQQIFKNAKFFFSGVNNTSLESTLDKNKFTGVFEVKKPLVNLEIARKLNKNLKTVYLVGDGSLTADNNIYQYKQNFENTKDINFVYLNDINISSILQKLDNYDKNSVMLLMVFSAFEQNQNHISDMEALKLLSKQYKNPMITHDSVYVNIDNQNIIGGNCSDAEVAGNIVANDIMHYFNGIKIKDIPYKFEQGNSTYLNEKVLNHFKLNIYSLGIENPIIVNKNDSIFKKYQIWIYSIIGLFIIMLIYIFIKVQKQKSLEEFNEKIQKLNEQLEEKIKEKTQSLLIENKRFQSVLDTTMEAVIISKNGICIDVNQSGIVLMGYDSKEEMLGKNMLDFVYEDSKELVKSKIVQDDVKPYEAFVVRKNGSHFPAYLRGTNTEDKSMRISSVIDITHLKQLEANSKMAAMGEMIGNIAHQWRQPLSVITTSATGLMMQNEYGLLDDAKLNKACENININAQYLSKTIDDFRNFIKEDISIVTISIKDIVNETMNLLNATLSNNYIEVSINIHDNLVINVAKNELQQALINIINNAKDVLVEKVDEGERAIFIESKKIDNDTLELTICDNGGGIPQEIMDKIFEPYFTTKHQSQGTGLGLSMAHKIITERHHQTLLVYNDELIYQGKNYKGACFKIIFSNKMIN